MRLTNRPRGARALSRVTTATRLELSATLAGAGVQAPFHPHITDLKTGRHGVSWCVMGLLYRASARNAATGLSAAQVERAFRPFAGEYRHKPASLAVFLSQYMIRHGWLNKAPRGGRVRYWLTPQAITALEETK